MPQAAELFIIDELMNGRLIAAHRAVGIATQFQGIDFHRQGIEANQPPRQAVTLAEDDLDRFQGFDDADQTR